MFTVYVVNGTYKFSHYGEALSYARRIGGTITTKKSCNPLRVFNAIYDSIQRKEFCVNTALRIIGILGIASSFFADGFDQVDKNYFMLLLIYAEVAYSKDKK